MIACRRSRLRILKSRQKLQKKLTGCCQKLHDVQQDSGHQLLAAANLSGAQLSVVEECIAAGKCKSKQQRRYDDNWLLLCLLLHIRTLTGYWFLRDHDILPLPSVKTVQKHLSMVGLKCGFNQDFFLALKIKSQHKAEFEKHGILIFDEIQVRKSKAVNSRTMTHTGMVDDEEDTQKSSELGDHGLALFHQDQLVPGDVRVCLKLTVAHIHPSQTDKMRVNLATQEQAIPEMNCEGTIHFTMHLNNLFDALNRRYLAGGLKPGCSDLLTVKNAITRLDDLQAAIEHGNILRELFLTNNTSKLLRNDHPSMPTFLQLYRPLPVKCLRRPPKFGNCEAVFRDNELSEALPIVELRDRLDGLISTSKWECDDLIPNDDDE
ncbi:hypothetical protein HPB47_007423, partial [Ixodes persulcatus]